MLAAVGVPEIVAERPGLGLEDRETAPFPTAQAPLHLDTEVVVDSGQRSHVEVSPIDSGAALPEQGPVHLECRLRTSIGVDPGAEHGR